MFDTCTNYIFYFLQQTTSNPLKTTCRLVKMRIWSSIESITECVRKNSLKCKFLMYCYQTCFMIGLTNDHIMILTNHIWCYKASSAHGVKIKTSLWKRLSYYWCKVYIFKHIKQRICLKLLPIEIRNIRKCTQMGQGDLKEEIVYKLRL